MLYLPGLGTQWVKVVHSLLSLPSNSDQTELRGSVSVCLGSDENSHALKPSLFMDYVILRPLLTRQLGSELGGTQWLAVAHCSGSDALQQLDQKK